MFSYDTAHKNSVFQDSVVDIVKGVACPVEPGESNLDLNIMDVGQGEVTDL